MRRLKFALAGAALCCLSHGALAQANGDPGAASEGQLAAQKTDQQRGSDQQKKSGVTSMAKGASGGTGDPKMQGGSNSLSGSGSTKQP